ncbi:MAG: hypothetical protein HQM14_06385 [SAR324 cluster bacterium]|nr:hypothetical protein [SAR324 cluster bacterium]
MSKRRKDSHEIALEYYLGKDIDRLSIRTGLRDAAVRIDKASCIPFLHGHWEAELNGMKRDINNSTSSWLTKFIKKKALQFFPHVNVADCSDLFGYIGWSSTVALQKAAKSGSEKIKKEAAEALVLKTRLAKRPHNGIFRREVVTYVLNHPKSKDFTLKQYRRILIHTINAVTEAPCDQTVETFIKVMGAYLSKLHHEGKSLMEHYQDEEKQKLYEDLRTKQSSGGVELGEDISVDREQLIKDIKTSMKLVNYHLDVLRSYHSQFLSKSKPAKSRTQSGMPQPGKHGPESSSPDNKPKRSASILNELKNYKPIQGEKPTKSQKKKQQQLITFAHDMVSWMKWFPILRKTSGQLIKLIKKVDERTSHFLEAQRLEADASRRLRILHNTSHIDQYQHRKIADNYKYELQDYEKDIARLLDKAMESYDLALKGAKSFEQYNFIYLRSKTRLVKFICINNLANKSKKQKMLKELYPVLSRVKIRDPQKLLELDNMQKTIIAEMGKSGIQPPETIKAEKKS